MIKASPTAKTQLYANGRFQNPTPLSYTYNRIVRKYGRKCDWFRLYIKEKDLILNDYQIYKRMVKRYHRDNGSKKMISDLPDIQYRLNQSFSQFFSDSHSNLF